MTDGSLRVDEAERQLLAEVFDGCEFSADAVLRFLRLGGDLDVQAAPGSGKTTLLVAKLLLLARSWPDTRRGICVLSHTNAARYEVQQRLGSHPMGSALLGYPHFIGTITTLLHQFLALPLLRGAGWQVEHVDSDLSRGLAFKAAHRKRSLGYMLRQPNTRRRAEAWVSQLILGDDDELGLWPPRNVPIVMNGPGKTAKVYPELREVKAEVLAQGVYSFADMVSLARRCVRQCGPLTAAISKRFPLVFVDETQDTGSPHLDLLGDIFRGRSTVQRLGDVNQTIYEEEDDGTGSGNRWSPGAAAINLGHSRRLGPLAARFASALTVHAEQSIEPGHDQESKPVLIVFDESTIGRVIPRFAELAAERCPGALADGFTAMAVASRHRPGEGKQWPGSLVHYCSAYCAPGTRRDGGDVARRLFLALAAARAGEPLRNCFRAFCLAAARVPVGDGPVASPGARRPAELEEARDVRRVFLGQAMSGEFTRSEGWDAFAAELMAVIGSNPDTSAAGTELLFPGHSSAPTARTSSNVWVCPVDGGDVRVAMGSIHSVKGQTHDATLVLDTPINRVHDVELALRCAFGGERKPSADQTHKFRAITNVFVGATRARRLLCLATPKNDGKGKRGKAMAAIAKVWDVIDLTTEQVAAAASSR